MNLRIFRNQSMKVRDGKEKRKGKKIGRPVPVLQLSQAFPKNRENGRQKIIHEITQGHFIELQVMSSEIERACSGPSTIDENRATLENITVKFQNIWGQSSRKLQGRSNISHIKRIRITGSDFGFLTVSTAVQKQCLQNCGRR